MDMGRLSLAIKLIQEEYRLTDHEMKIFTHRMLADESEFERVWEIYKNKSLKFRGGVDKFKDILSELIR